MKSNDNINIIKSKFVNLIIDEEHISKIGQDFINYCFKSSDSKEFELASDILILMVGQMMEKTNINQEK
jgi:hypothetical protein